MEMYSCGKRLFFSLGAAIFETRKARQLQNKLSSTLYITANVQENTVSAGGRLAGRLQPWGFDNYSRRDMSFLASKQLKTARNWGVGGREMKIRS